MIEKVFFNRSELAHALGLSARTVARLLSAGKLPRPIRLGKRLLWRVEDVRNWAAELPTEGHGFEAKEQRHVAQKSPAHAPSSGEPVPAAPSKSDPASGCDTKESPIATKAAQAIEQAWNSIPGVVSIRGWSDENLRRGGGMMQ